MSTRLFPHRLPRAAALFAACFLSLACSLPLTLPAGLGGEMAPASDGGGADAGGDFPLAPLACPQEDTTVSLTFNHDIQFKNVGMGRFRMTVTGTYKINIISSIHVTEFGDQYGVHNIDSGPLDVRVTVEEFEDCDKGVGKTTMRADVTGNCLDDTLTLAIRENYKEGQVTMVCGEGDDKKEVPIPLPLGPLEQPMTLTMSYTELAGRGSMNKAVPFMGLGGSGGWDYILIM